MKSVFLTLVIFTSTVSFADVAEDCKREVLSEVYNGGMGTYTRKAEISNNPHKTVSENVLLQILGVKRTDESTKDRLIDELYAEREVAVEDALLKLKECERGIF